MNITRTLTAVNLSPRKSAIRGIVLHDTAGSGGHGDARYLANDPERRKVSIDFCIIKDGTIYQINPDIKNKYTNHAGRSTRWSAKGLSGIQINKSTIGIEIAQKAAIDSIPDPKYPDIQVQAVAFVCAKMCKEFGLSKLDITTHKDLITDGSRSDPRKFPWSDFWNLFNQYTAEAQFGPETRPTDAQNHRIKHTVGSEDTLYSLARQYNTKVEVIKSLNNINEASNLIKVGQVLIVKE